MSKYRHRLPQLQDRLFLSDGGLETTLIYQDGLDLPYFAAFDLLKDEAGTQVLRRYFDRYAEIASRGGTGLVLEAPTWRANPDWAARLGYDAGALADANRRAIALLLEVRTRWETADSPIVVSGNLGPRGDGYRADARMSAAAAADYHQPQVDCFAATEADMVAAFTMNYVEEAVGIALAARRAAMPLALSFTVETDGRLPDGTALVDALRAVEEASDAHPAYYMLNCAHPDHFAHVLAGLGSLAPRLKGVRANASRRSHAELDASTDLDAGDPQELGLLYRGLREQLPGLTLFGGCCGTDHRHVAAACTSLADGPRRAA